MSNNKYKRLDSVLVRLEQYIYSCENKQNLKREQAIINSLIKETKLTKVQINKC